MKISFYTIILIYSLLFLNLTGIAQKGIIAGTIYGGEGPLENATVSIGSITRSTNTFGKFSLKLDPGFYIISISHISYKNLIQQIEVKTADTTILNFRLIIDEKAEETVLIGSRAPVQRSNLHTAVPVDVISAHQLLQTGQASITQMLQLTVPSFNASRQVVNEPITLRGLDPDQVLILVNGKRYHNMSWVNFGGVRGILGRGAVSNDLNSIPFSAIDKIEILKDGASAQYGSDAIAGVINIRLKNFTDKIWAHTHVGEYYKSDGETVSIGFNYGMGINKKDVSSNKNGFLNFSGAYRLQNPTYRGGRYNGTVYTNNVSMDDSIIKARNFDRHNLSNAGSSKHDELGFVMNGAYELGKQTGLFMTAGLNHRTTVFTSGYVFPKNASRINPEIFPNGFQSRAINQSNDAWGIAGMKGKSVNDWLWEFNIAYGINWANYYSKQTNNASQYFTLGKNAPTSFYTGSLLYGQLVNTIQTTKRISLQNKKIINLDFGTEWRLEYFQIKEGEEASWKNYDTRKQGGSTGLVLSPNDAIIENRSAVCSFVDIESEFSDRLLINTAGRYEYYSDFGANLAGKLAMRYKLTKRLALRASISNGFRAPSLQQRYYSFTRLGPPNSLGILPLIGTFRNNSNVTKALGIPSLDAERSINLSGGITANIHENIRLTADAYWIQIKNRIVLSGIFDRSVNQNVAALLTGITDVDQVQFFTNAINTKTKGLDIVMNGNWKINKTDLLVMLGANFTQTRLFGGIKAAGNLKADSLNTNTLFNNEEITKIEHGQPENKIILSFTYKIQKANITIRNTRFGKTVIAPAFTDPATRITSFLNETFSPKILTDISLTYSLKKWLTATLGANNIFDIYPDRLKDYRNTTDGLYIYSQDASPFGFNGGYYFISMEMKL